MRPGLTKLNSKTSQLDSNNSKVFQQLAKINYQSLSSLQCIMKDSSSFAVFHNCFSSSVVSCKVVLHLTSDINCLYSIYAAKNGARHVYCVLNGHNENQKKNLYMIQEIIKQNGLEEKITACLWGKLKIRQKVDIIIGQPMGYNMIYDGMIDRIIEARDMYLDKQTGLILPNRLTYHCAFIWDQYQKDEKIQYWDEVYGISMKGIKNWVEQQPSVKTVDPTLIVSSVSNFLNINLYSASYTQIDQISRTITARPLSQENLKANGLTIWFQTSFNLPDGQSLTIDTSPWCEESRWCHFTLYTREQWKFEQNKEKKWFFKGKKNHMTGNAVIKIKSEDREDSFVIW